MRNDLGKPLTGRAVIYRKEAVEDCSRFHISQLKEALRQGKGGASASFDLAYTLNGEDIKESFALTKTPCHFGGFRWWFTCPGCGGRRGVLYKPYYARCFRCRHCHNLAYKSTQMRRNHWEPFFQSVNIEHRYIRVLEGVGQKGFSKRELIQKGKIEKQMLSIAKILNESTEKFRKRCL